MIKKTDNRQDEIALALKKWHEAINYFESVKDPDLIDFAIYDMEAARRRYIFLLKHAPAKKQFYMEEQGGRTIQSSGVCSGTADTLDTV